MSSSTMVKHDDGKFWKLEMLAETSKTVFEKKERIVAEIPEKRKVGSFSSRPEWLVNVMREVKGYDPKFIIKRTLYPTDLNKGQSRLSMPLNQVVDSDFLTEEETRIIYKQSELKIRKEGVNVVLVDPLLTKHEVDLRKWKIGGNWNYVLVDGWNKVVANNRFEKYNVTEIWSFRYRRGKLCLALSPPTRGSSRPGQSRSRPS